MVGWVGFEPTTNGLKGRCSTPELPSRYVIDSTRTLFAVNDFFQKSSRQNKINQYFLDTIYRDTKSIWLTLLLTRHYHIFDFFKDN